MDTDRAIAHWEHLYRTYLRKLETLGLVATESLHEGDLVEGREVAAMAIA